LTEGKNGKQLNAREEFEGEGDTNEHPCPICGLFHGDWCKMKIEEKEAQ